LTWTRVILVIGSGRNESQKDDVDSNDEADGNQSFFLMPGNPFLQSKPHHDERERRKSPVFSSSFELLTKSGEERRHPLHFPP
jgi:hypothetical protein